MYSGPDWLDWDSYWNSYWDSYWASPGWQDRSEEDFDSVDGTGPV